VARAAEAQVGVTLRYDPSYTKLAFPGGDVPLERGVCSDVVIRSFRRAGIDLQVEVNRDMRRSFTSYPRMWGLRAPDANIDHRRVPNLMTFFARKGKSVPIAGAYEPGDVVAWRLAGGLHHIGVISTRKASPRGDYLVVHNIGQGARNEDVLRAYTIIGHYRW
jgi:uncharacterized protein YijF (DUF1287 family)